MQNPTFLRFVQFLTGVPPTSDFSLRDLPGSGRRIDVLCRDLAACFEWGPVSWDRTNLEVVAVFSKDVTLSFRSVEGRQHIGEAGWAELIKQALQGSPVEGISMRNQTPGELIDAMKAEASSRILVLDEEGEPLFGNLHASEFTKNSFMLGDHRGFDSQIEELITSHGLQRVSLGERSYLSSHCVAAIISYYERLSR